MSLLPDLHFNETDVERNTYVLDLEQESDVDYTLIGIRRHGRIHYSHDLLSLMG